VINYFAGNSNFYMNRGAFHNWPIAYTADGLIIFGDDNGGIHLLEPQLFKNRILIH